MIDIIACLSFFILPYIIIQLLICYTSVLIAIQLIMLNSIDAASGDHDGPDVVLMCLGVFHFL